MRDLPAGATNGGWVIQLPEHFVDSLRVLFDILDTSRCGIVSFEQIAKKWGNFPSPTNHLPSHFLESLRKVTPVGGMLTFERFLAGVRLSLQERRQDHNNNCSRLQRVRSEGKLEDGNYFGSTRDRKQGSQSRAGGLPAMGLNGYGRPNHLNGALSHRSQPAINENYLPDSRKTSFESAKRAINENLSLNGTVASRKAQAANYSIVMRPKKMKSVRAPLPPQHDSPRPDTAISLPNRSFRPLSTNSMGSVCSSGMTEVRWRNSRMSNAVNAHHVNNDNNSSSPSPPSNSTAASYAEELQPQVAKHEQLLNEEHRIVEKGVETTQNLLDWYISRMESLEKRRKMLEKGMVALDTSVHEQKLNFYRAQITELNRRMKGLIASSERGFPSHQNMLRVPIAPAKAGGSLGGSSASSTSTNPSSSPHSSPEPGHTLHFFKQQHQKLLEELDTKSRLIEELQREKLVHYQNQQTFGGIDKSLFNNNRINCISHINKPISGHANSEASRFKSNYTAHNNNNCSKAIKIHDTLL